MHFQFLFFFLSSCLHSFFVPLKRLNFSVCHVRIFASAKLKCSVVCSFETMKNRNRNSFMDNFLILLIHIQFAHRRIIGMQKQLQFISAFKSKRKIAAFKCRTFSNLCYPSTISSRTIILICNFLPFPLQHNVWLWSIFFLASGKQSVEFVESKNEFVDKNGTEETKGKWKIFDCLWRIVRLNF